jgi:hypothetical protein
MSDIPVWPLLLFATTTWIGWSVLSGARMRRRRAQALSDHARSLPEAIIVPLHDHLLDTALAHYNERALRAGKVRLEFAVALRDRLDELAGREHGPLNRARIRSRLLPAAYRLRDYPNPFRVREFRETFLLGDGAAADGGSDARNGSIPASGDLEHLVQAFAEVYRRGA